MIASILFIAFAVLLIVGAPIAVCLGSSSILAMLAQGAGHPIDTIMSSLPRLFAASSSKFVLLAIPFFILAGNIMEKAGISERLINLAEACVGHVKGGLAIVCVVVALALILIVAWPTNAVVTSFLSLVLRRGLGVGAYILPILLIIVAGTFVARFESERVPTRVVIGLALMYFGLLVLVALFTPGAIDENGAVTNALFDETQVVYHGGYLGAGPAYLGFTLLGLPVSVVIAIGIMAVGLVVIGFSVRKVVDAVRRHREEALRREEEELGVAPDSPYIPMTRGRSERLQGASSSARTQLIEPAPAAMPASSNSTARLSDKISGGRTSQATSGGTTQ